MSRYLTQPDKLHELRAWETVKNERTARPPQGFTGGIGYPDPEIYQWVDRLNRLHRVCTLQSCAGHVCTPESMCDYCAGIGTPYQTGPNAHVWNGQLWLWLDEPLSHWLHYHALELAALPCIEKVGAIYHVDQREIWDIQPLGAGHGQLDTSMACIVGLLERGNRECNLR